MNPFERIPTRWLLTGAALACLALWAGPSFAQVSGDPVQGKRLFENTPDESGNSQLTASCNGGCHGDVANRRSRIATQLGLPGGAFADISIDTAHTRLVNATNNVSAMSQFRAPNGLSSDQLADIAAYIADTPKVNSPNMATGNVLAFAASASGVSVTQNLTIQHAATATENLRITGIAFAAGATAFSRSTSCPSNTQLMPAGGCTFSVTYRPTSNTGESKVMTVSLTQGTTSFTRTVTLNGTVASSGGGSGGGGTTPPATSGSDDSGGGALGWAWLSGLALATGVLARRRRHT